MANRLTIILSSYNRPNLLRRAVDSCRTQVDRGFDLVIFDDASQEDTRQYLRSVQHDPMVSVLIMNATNLGFSASVNAALHAVQTEWATILCDDDFLDANFVASSRVALERSDKDCIVASFHQVDAKGRVLKSFTQQQQSLDTAQALAANLPIAGISGFFFRIGRRTDRNLMRDYPRSFFSDTLFAIEFMLANGVDTSADAYYYKTVWDQSESALDAHSARQFFEAMLRYREELASLLEHHGASGEIKSSLLKPMSLLHFTRVLLLPILARGALSRSDIDAWFVLARRYDPAFIPHCWLVSVAWLVANHRTLGIRKLAHRAYRRWIMRRPVR